MISLESTSRKKNQGDRPNRIHPDSHFLVIIHDYQQKISRLIVDVLQLSRIL